MSSVLVLSSLALHAQVRRFNLGDDLKETTVLLEETTSSVARNLGRCEKIRRLGQSNQSVGFGVGESSLAVTPLRFVSNRLYEWRKEKKLLSLSMSSPALRPDVPLPLCVARILQNHVCDIRLLER